MRAIVWLGPHLSPAVHGIERRATHLRTTDLSCCTPGEFLFEFYRESDHSRWLCEPRDHGKVYGVEAQFFKNEELDRARRFDPRLDASRPSRELAVAWAEQERKHIEAFSARKT